MNLQHQRISELCQQLRLEHIANDWPDLASKTIEQDKTLSDFLEQLLLGWLLAILTAERLLSYQPAKRENISTFIKESAVVDISTDGRHLSGYL